MPVITDDNEKLTDQKEKSPEYVTKQQEERPGLSLEVRGCDRPQEVIVAVL